MNTSELAAKVAEANNVSKSEAKSLIEAFLAELISVASSGTEIALSGFGKFKVKETPEREGRNPGNGDKIRIAASKKLAFTPAEAVKDSLNGTSSSA
jgi:DNA-binding protein HU-beta